MPALGGVCAVMGSSSIEPDTALRSEILRALANDRKMRTGKKKAERGFSVWTFRGDFLYHKNRLYVPHVPHIRTTLLQEHHDVPDGGHFGLARTVARLQQAYYWPDMARDVQDYIRTCPTC